MARKDEWCRHYQGFQHEACKAGCRMADVDCGERFSPPCTNAERADKCPKREEWTEAEIREREERILAALMASVHAKDAIVKHHEATGACSGTIPCPACGMDMRFSIAPHNRHARAKCATEDCTHFIE